MIEQCKFSQLHKHFKIRQWLFLSLPFHKTFFNFRRLETWEDFVWNKLKCEILLLVRHFVKIDLQVHDGIFCWYNRWLASFPTFCHRQGDPGLPGGYIFTTSPNYFFLGRWWKGKIFETDGRQNLVLDMVGKIIAEFIDPQLHWPQPNMLSIHGYPPYPRIVFHFSGVYISSLRSVKRGLILWF